VTTDGEVAAVVEAVRNDGAPRILERDGEDIAVVVSPDDFPGTGREPKSWRNRDRILALAGSWKDLDTDKLIDDIYRWRHESPASPPVNLE
jgi:hypothetical protein